jgi:hypothetical protein
MSGATPPTPSDAANVHREKFTFILIVIVISIYQTYFHVFYDIHPVVCVLVVLDILLSLL